MLSAIMEVSDVLILTSSNTARSLPIEILKKELYKLLGAKKTAGKHVPVEVFEMDSISNSLNFALKISGSNDIICITGSITNLEACSLGGLMDFLKYFDNIMNFFKLPIWKNLIYGIVFILAIIWLSFIYWTYRDAKLRNANPNILDFFCSGAAFFRPAYLSYFKAA